MPVSLQRNFRVSDYVVAVNDIAVCIHNVASTNSINAVEPAFATVGTEFISIVPPSIHP